MYFVLITPYRKRSEFNFFKIPKRWSSLLWCNQQFLNHLSILAISLVYLYKKHWNSSLGLLWYGHWLLLSFPSVRKFDLRSLFVFLMVRGIFWYDQWVLNHLDQWSHIKMWRKTFNADILFFLPLDTAEKALFF